MIKISLSSINLKTKKMSINNKANKKQAAILLTTYLITNS
jgi:hypothetical protein